MHVVSGPIVMERKVLGFGEVNLLGIGEAFIEGIRSCSEDSGSPR